MIHEELQKPPSLKRGYLFAGAIVLALAAFSAGWYWASGKLSETVDQVRADLLAQGRTLNCDGQDVRGYPFRIGLFCEDVAYTDPSNAVSFSAGQLRSAAQFYNPGHVIAELDGPANVVAPNLAPLLINWSNLRSSTRVTTSGLERMSIQGDQLNIAANDGGQASPLAQISSIQLHARPAPDGNGPDALQFAANIDGWDIEDGDGDAIEPVNIAIDATVEEGMAFIRSQAELVTWLRSRGGRAQVSEISLMTQSGGKLTMSGPLEVSESGRISGEVTVDIISPDLLIAYAGKVFPPLKQVMENSIGMLGNGEIKNLKLTLRDGKIYAGFFPLGEIPQLF